MESPTDLAKCCWRRPLRTIGHQRGIRGTCSPTCDQNGTAPVVGAEVQHAVTAMTVKKIPRVNGSHGCYGRRDVLGDGVQGLQLPHSSGLPPSFAAAGGGRKLARIMHPTRKPRNRCQIPVSSILVLSMIDQCSPGRGMMPIEPLGIFLWVRSALDARRGKVPQL